MSLYCSPRVHCRSHIRSLPVEILSFIFVLSTHYDDGDSDDDGKGEEEQNLPFIAGNMKVPLILSSVSRQWRSIVHHTPALWTNICLSVEYLDGGDDDAKQTGSVFAKSRLEAYLEHSRNYPLDILIDARDDHWDFSEPDISYEDGWDAYNPPFSSAHMVSALDTLLPHLSRWRSVAILTDIWAPMYVALQQIQPAITTLGAPLLRSLTLMRCNDFVSYSPVFEPQQMKNPAFLGGVGPSLTNLLPQLRNLTLRGVHLDWSGLASVLSHNTQGLSTLELSSHSLEVRPTLAQFRRLLSTSPGLTSLVVNGSGPCVPDQVSEGGGGGDPVLDRPDPDPDPVSLPALRDVTLGYRSASEALAVLEMLNAPNVRRLSLEDASHPGETEEVDAGRLLMYIGTGEFFPVLGGFVVAYAVADGEHYQLGVEKGPLVRQEELELEQVQEDSIHRKDDKSGAFPMLESVTLKGVKCCPRTLHAFFGALPNLQRLEMSQMSMRDVRALLPHRHSGGSLEDISCPCPRLQSLCIRGFGQMHVQDLAFFVGGLAVERVKRGGCRLREVDIHMDDERKGGCVMEGVMRVAQVGTTVKVIREVQQEEEEEEEEEVGDSGWEDPFKPGGIFNDPVFDAYYAGRVLG